MKKERKEKQSLLRKENEMRKGSVKGSIHPTKKRLEEIRKKQNKREAIKRGIERAKENGYKKTDDIVSCVMVELNHEGI